MTTLPAAPSFLQALIQREGLPDAFSSEVSEVHLPLAQGLAAAAGRRPGLVVGVCGPQGSGKTTMCEVLQGLLAEQGLRAVTLSLDDLYLPRAERERLAREVHPLLVTRGPPGTHDVDIGRAVLDGLRAPGLVRAPRFEKATDDRRPEPAAVAGAADVVLFEGWCVGARPQSEEQLARPVNALEREEDPDGVWRRFTNTALAGPYQGLFGELDRLVLLRPPSWEVVLGWRTEQEHKLRRRLQGAGADPARTMSDPELARFVSHYERLTRHIMAEMPPRADFVLRLDGERRATLTTGGAQAAP